MTPSTVLCQEHFKDSDIGRGPNCWNSVHGAVPSLKLYNVEATKSSKVSRKAPKDCSSRKALKERSSFVNIQDRQPCSSATSEEIFELDDLSYLKSDSKFITCSTQNDFSFINSPVVLSDSDDTGDSLKTDHCYFALSANENDQKCYVDLQQKINQHSSQIECRFICGKKALFSIDKLQNDDSAVKFYTGFLITLH